MSCGKYVHSVTQNVIETTSIPPGNRQTLSLKKTTTPSWIVRLCRAVITTELIIVNMRGTLQEPHHLRCRRKAPQNDGRPQLRGTWNVFFITVLQAVQDQGSRYTCSSSWDLPFGHSSFTYSIIRILVCVTNCTPHFVSLFLLFIFFALFYKSLPQTQSS